MRTAANFSKPSGGNFYRSEHSFSCLFEGSDHPGLRNDRRKPRQPLDEAIKALRPILMFPPPPDRPLSEAECDRLAAMLSRLGSEHAMNNLEEIDGFFAALICSPNLALPSDYLPEIWGGELAGEEAFADEQELQDFLSLLLRHWNSMVRVLEEEDVFLPFLLQDENGVAHANDWARGFLRGMAFDPQSWQALFDDEERGGVLIPILILAHEHDPDPEMRPYKEPIDAKRREELLVGIAASVTLIYRHFAPHRQRRAARFAAEGAAERKIGRNDPCPCGSGKKYKHCCGKITLQ